MKRSQIRFVIYLLWFFSVLLVGRLVPARAGEPPTEPVLRIETGMHTTRINRIASDAQGRYLVTGAHDKTVRVWELPTGRLLRTLRPPIGDGSEGSIVAVAMSPDGNTIACGGETGGAWDQSYSIYLFDRATGQMTQRIVGLPNTIAHLAYSHDGRYLAAVGKFGIRIFRLFRGGNATLEAKDEDYNDSCYSIEFAADGRVVTTADDGLVRLYDKTFKLIAKQKSPGGIEPWSARFSPDGSKVAVGFLDKAKVDVLSAHDLSYLYSPDTAGLEPHQPLFQVAWSADGRFLYAAGNYVETLAKPVETLAKPAGGGFAILGQQTENNSGVSGNATHLMRKWEGAGQGRFHDIPTGARGSILYLASLPNSSIAYSSLDPAFGIIDATDHQTLFKGPANADYRTIGQHFLISDDGTTMQFGFAYGGASPAQFSLLNRDWSNNLLTTSQHVTLHPPLIQSPNFQITGWEDTQGPQLNGAPIPIEAHEIAHALAIMPNQSVFFLGGSFALYRFNIVGDGLDLQKSQRIFLPTQVLGLNVTADGKVLVAALSDGTIRWYKTSNLQELLAFFPAPDRKRWVLWTPRGYYDTSIGGEDLIGWHLNRGKNEAADFFPVSHVRNIYYRPDVVQRILTTLDEPAALRLADAAAGRNAHEENIVGVLPPVVNIVSPDAEADVTANEVTIRYNVRSPSGELVTGIKALIDGRPAPETRDFVLVEADAPNSTVNAASGATKDLVVKIPARDCEVSLVAQNRFAVSAPATVRLHWKQLNNPPNPADTALAETQPRLYVLAIGVSAYQDRDLILQFSAKDARDFSNLMQAQKDALYRDVEVRVLTDKEATKQNILNGLQWIQRVTTSNDIAMVFLSGHGANDATGSYFFVPQNFDRTQIQQTGLSYTNIKNVAASISGKALFFVDSCRSGGVLGNAWNKTTDVTGMVNELTSAENGVIVFCASTGKQVSWEDEAWGNGAFTKALLEGLRGGADYTHKSKITINMINLYLSERVKDLTQGKQTPTVAIPQTIADFPITVKK